MEDYETFSEFPEKHVKFSESDHKKFSKPFWNEIEKINFSWNSWQIC